jgi:hypothetical protein
VSRRGDVPPRDAPETAPGAADVSVADRLAREARARDDARHNPEAFIGPRAVRAAQLRYTRATYAEVGRELGVSTGRANQLVRVFVRRIVHYYLEPGEEMPGLEWVERVPEYGGDWYGWFRVVTWELLEAALLRYAEMMDRPRGRPRCAACGQELPEIPTAVPDGAT